MVKSLNIDAKKLSIILSLVVLLLIFFSFKTEKDFQRFEIEGNAQGTTYKIIYYAKEAKILESQVYCILSEIDSSMSIYKEYSLINKFNNNAKGVLMDTHFKTDNSKDGTWYALRDFYDCIIYKKEPTSNIKTGSNTAFCVHLANQSMYNHKIEYWKDYF